MFVSKNYLIDILVGIARKDEKYLKIMEDAVQRKTKIWGSFEWGCVKDSEMCIKALFREYLAGNFSEFENIKDLLTCDVSELHQISDPWVLEIIVDCRNDFENMELQERKRDARN